jgi:hypothetical protein
MASAPAASLWEKICAPWKEIDTFLFGYGSPTMMGVIRIFIGLVNFANYAIILPSFAAWFTEAGWTPHHVTDAAFQPIARDYTFFGTVQILPFQVPRLDLLSNVSDGRLMLAFYLFAMLVALLTILGLFTRASTILLAICVVSLQHRNVLILHGGDNVMRVGALYLALMPCGKACSLDRLRGLWSGKITKEPVLVSMWPQRLLAINTAVCYFTSWWIKMDGTRWRNGTATWYTERLDQFHRFPVPEFMRAAWIQPLFTYGTLVTELSLGTIVFWRPARKWALLAGLFVHGFIEYSMNIPLFAFAMCTWYLAFYEGDEVTAWALRIGGRLARFKITAILPKGAQLKPGPALTLEAMDPLGLVEIKSGDGPPLPERAIWIRSVGAWGFGLVPGLWHRFMRASVATDGPAGTS